MYKKIHYLCGRIFLAFLQSIVDYLRSVYRQMHRCGTILFLYLSFSHETSEIITYKLTRLFYYVVWENWSLIRKLVRHVPGNSWRCIWRCSWPMHVSCAHTSVISRAAATNHSDIEAARENAVTEDTAIGSRSSGGETYPFVMKLAAVGHRYWMRRP